MLIDVFYLNVARLPSFTNITVYVKCILCSVTFHFLALLLVLPRTVSKPPVGRLCMCGGDYAHYAVVASMLHMVVYTGKNVIRLIHNVSSTYHLAAV